MDVKLIEKPAFQIVGVSQKVPCSIKGKSSNHGISTAHYTTTTSGNAYI